MSHIFFSTKELDLNTKVSIINDSISYCSKYWIDKLDCNQSFARQKMEMSFEEIMLKFNNHCHFTVIHRQGIIEPDYGEIGFSTMTGVSYFLWILLSIEDFYRIIKQYNLKKANLYGDKIENII